jgi:hypothetical protein
MKVFALEKEKSSIGPNRGAHAARLKASIGAPIDRRSSILVRSRCEDWPEAAWSLTISDRDDDRIHRDSTVGP